MSKIADDSESIAKRLKEIEAEKLQALTHEDEKPKPEPVVWPMYGGGSTFPPSALNEAARQYMAAQNYQGAANQYNPYNSGYAGLNNGNPYK